MSDAEQEPVRFGTVDGASHLALHGVVDLFAAADLRELALQCVETGRATCFDCRQLERIDGSVLQIMLALERDLRERAIELTLLGVPENVSRYLRLAGARSLLEAARQPPAFASDARSVADAEGTAAELDPERATPSKDGLS